MAAVESSAPSSSAPSAPTPPGTRDRLRCRRATRRRAECGSSTSKGALRAATGFDRFVASATRQRAPPARTKPHRPARADRGCGRAPRFDVERGARRGILDRVLDEVDQRLSEEGRVARDEGRRRDRGRDLPAAEAPEHRAHDLLDRLGRRLPRRSSRSRSRSPTTREPRFPFGLRAHRATLSPARPRSSRATPRLPRRKGPSRRQRERMRPRPARLA